MSALLATFLQREPDAWFQLLILALFFGFPLVARMIRALLSRAGIAPPGEDEASPAQRAENRRRLREARRRAEVEGEDLWRRLARGEDVAPPPETRRPSQPTVFTAGTDAPREVSLELEAPAPPLSVLGGVSEPSEAPETSLETSAAPEPLSALGPSLGEGLAPAAVVPARRAFGLGRGDLRRAVVLSEVLGPPVSDRPLRA